MGFSSVPLYLDPPNWQQQQQQLLQANGTAGNEININNNNHNNNNLNHHNLIPPLPQQQPLPHQHQVGLNGYPGVGRPNSMVERARQAKIPPPEGPLKCPRCESTNTKFCYYNNYSLTQPRHFCKTCRRYWTRGGALRNVPVGGGCRRNKRSSGGGNKSSSTSSASAAKSGSSLSSMGPTARGSFMASLQSIAQLGGIGSLPGLSFSGSLLHNNGVNPLDQLDNYGISNPLLSQHLHNHNHHQLVSGFPSFLGGYENIVVGGDHENEVGKAVKMEGGLISTPEMNATSSVANNNNSNSNDNDGNNNNNNNQFWGNIGTNNMWSTTNNNSTHLSGMSSNSTNTTSHLL